MQILVLGMHRSGTSALSRILNMMGAYFGPEGSSMGYSAQNPKGFWERRDVRNLTDLPLLAVGCDWWKTNDFDPATLPDDVREKMRTELRKLIHSLDAHRPWFIKDPRLCIELPLWRAELEVPVAVVCNRQPLQVAHSLKTRNGFPLVAGIALWERYTRDALRYSADLPRVLVQHRELMLDPVATTKRLHAELEALGVQRLQMPSEREVTAFIDPELFRERAGDEELAQWLTPAQLDLHEKLSSGRIDEIEPEPLGATVKDLLLTFETGERHVREFEKLEKQLDRERELIREHDRTLEQQNELLAEKLASEERARKRLKTLEQEQLAERKRMQAWLSELESSYDHIVGATRYRLADSASGVLRKVLRSSAPQPPVRKLTAEVLQRGREELELGGPN